MFGKNEISKARLESEGFDVHSVFYTIQGEGPFAGKPAIFVRLAGCNLRCTWCDTDFAMGLVMRPAELAEQLQAISKQHNCKFVVITGGEPLLQPLIQLIDHARLVSFTFQIETAGSVWPRSGLTKFPVQNKNLSVVCSPKTPGVVTSLRSAYEYNVYWKYIVRASEDVDPFDGLPRFSTQRPGEAALLFRPNKPIDVDRVYIQACDENDAIINKANLLYAAAIAMKHGYRLSVQQHKVVGLD